jgi:hypothetical protein
MPAMRFAGMALGAPRSYKRLLSIATNKNGRPLASRLILEPGLTSPGR